jgi:hypothetical protein
MGKKKNSYVVLMGKFEGKRPLERPRRRWEDKIKSNTEIRSEGPDWINLARNRDK